MEDDLRTAVMKQILEIDDTDLRVVLSLMSHLRTVRGKAGFPIRLDDVSDEEIWWGEVTGDKAAAHAAAAPLWDELAGLQKEPSKNARRIAELKLRLKSLGEI